MSLLSTFVKKLFSIKPKVKILEGLQGVQLADGIFHNLVVNEKVPGISVTLLKKGQVLLQKGYGYANLENEIPINPKETVFRIASISKCITGLALGKMVEDGLVNLDASLYDFLPEYPKKKHDFTLRQLANHTAGIRAYRGKEFALNIPFSIEESLEVFKDDPLVFEPGKGYLYNSFDFVLLSLAMQKAAQAPFENYVNQKVLMPLDMMQTHPPSKIDPVGETHTSAEFYSRTPAGFKKALPVNNYYKMAGGGYLSTSADIAQMGQAILDGALLKKNTYNQILTSGMVRGKPTYYGLGFQVSEDDHGRKFVGHVGNSVGAYTNFFVYPEEEVVAAILINCSDPKIQEDLDKAVSAVLDLPSS